MILDLEDDRVRAHWKSLSGGRYRLTIEGPFETDYTEPVFRALEKLLKPKPSVAIDALDATIRP